MGAADFKTGTCRGCGKAIVWAKDERGKPVPLDPSAPVYAVFEDEGRSGYQAVIDRTQEHGIGGKVSHLVSHFATCPKASQFSRSRPAPPA